MEGPLRVNFGRPPPLDSRSPPLARDYCLDTLRRRFHSPSRCRKFLESVLWKNGRFCPHCGGLRSWAIRSNAASKVRKGLYQCAECRRQFTVTVMTPFHSTKLELWKWFQVIYYLVTSSKGVSSVKMAKKVGVSQKTAWKMMHAIREMMDLRDELGPALKGVVEVDEKYLGGKPRKKKGVVHPRGKGTKKQPLLVMVQRKGPTRVVVIENDSYEVLEPIILKHVCTSAVLMSDQHACYQKIAPKFANHRFVNHSLDEFARTEEDGTKVHNNTAESVNALLELSYKGIYHWWSKKHLRRYIDETSFRWNLRKAVKRLKNVDGEMVECTEMEELPFMDLLRALLARAPWRQVRRTANNGIRPIHQQTYHWPSATTIPV